MTIREFKIWSLCFTQVKAQNIPYVLGKHQRIHLNEMLDTISKCCCSVTQSCVTLCNPMDCSTPGLPDHHHLLEFTQTHVH